MSTVAVAPLAIDDAAGGIEREAAAGLKRAVGGEGQPAGRIAQAAVGGDLQDAARDAGAARVGIGAASTSVPGPVIVRLPGR